MKADIKIARIFILVFCFFGALNNSATASDVSINIKEQIYAEVKPAFVLENLIQNDISGDNDKDVIVVLKEISDQKNKEGNSGNRQLIIFKNMGSDILKKVGFSNRVLLCSSCYGSLAGPQGGSPQIKISAKGVIDISQQSGSREISDVVLRFKYDANKNRILLIGKDANYSDRATGESVNTSINYITGSVIEKKYQYSEIKDKNFLIESNSKNIDKKLIYIEDAVADIE